MKSSTGQKPSAQEVQPLPRDKSFTAVFLYAAADHSMWYLIGLGLLPRSVVLPKLPCIPWLFIDHLPGTVLSHRNLRCYVLVYYRCTSALTWRRLTQNPGALRTALARTAEKVYGTCSSPARIDLSLFYHSENQQKKRSPFLKVPTYTPLGSHLHSPFLPQTLVSPSYSSSAFRSHVAGAS